MEKEKYTVWIDAAKQVASFHEIANSEAVEFDDHSVFMEYLNELSRNNYRFQ